MDATEILVTIGGIGLIAFVLWFFFGTRDESGPQSGGAAYSCPMHPWITSSDPTAECSICGMKLVKEDAGR